jgi:hypothetical protein
VAGCGPALLDRDHAELVNAVAAILKTLSWTVVLEYTFNHYGERGSVDVVAWHDRARALLLVEVKSRIIDIQALHLAMSRKTRVVPPLVVRDRRWRPATISQLLVVRESTAARRVVQQHAETFETTFPVRGVAARAWLREPSRSVSALWFLSPSTGGTGKGRLPSPQRVRVARSRSQDIPTGAVTRSARSASPRADA